MPSVIDNGVEHLARVACISLPSLASRSGNIDVSVSGSIVLQTEEVLHILIPAVNASPLLKPDLLLKSHLDPSQKIPFFSSPLSIKSCTPDTSKIGSSSEANFIAYQPRFMDAKWAPSEFGPNQSPILAGLTTQSQIFIYSADNNQFKGPWKQMECLTGGSERHILSITWAQRSPVSAWLLAGTTQGEVMVWSVEAGKTEPHGIFPLAEQEITSLYWSPRGLLAVVTNDQMLIAQAHTSAKGITFQASAHQPNPLNGSHVSLAKWQDQILLYCTPGQVHHFDAETGESQSVLLEDDGEEESCSMRPAASITPSSSDEWEVVLQDGTQYLINWKSLSGDFLIPTSYLAPANEAIGSLQRKVEAARGLLAKCYDGAGLTYTCHDGNQIASWSYHREPKCEFGLSLNHGSTAGRDLAVACHLLEAALKGDPRHTRTMITYYVHSSSERRNELMATILQALLHQVEDRQYLQAALRLSVWVQSEQGNDVTDKVRGEDLHNKLLDLNLARAIKSRLNLLRTSMFSFDQISDVQYCTLLGKAAHALSVRMKDGSLSKSSQQLLRKVGADASDTQSFDAGEICMACGSNVIFQSDTMLHAKCQKGHLWKRCATSLVLLTTSSNRTCSICSCETIQITEATCSTQKSLINSLTSCDLCDGKFFL